VPIPEGLPCSTSVLLGFISEIFCFTSPISILMDSSTDCSWMFYFTVIIAARE